jgi:hypothetical protein
VRGLIRYLGRISGYLPGFVAKLHYLGARGRAFIFVFLKDICRRTGASANEGVAW